MNRLEATFQGLDEDEAAFVAYQMGGDPTPKEWGAYARSLLEGGADVLEVGIPHSDPVADGPTIQAAGLRAREAGTRVDTVLELVRELRADRPEPLVLMTYANPVLRRGLDAFFRDAASAGADAVILPDVPLEESAPFREAAHAHDVGIVQLASPASGPDRVRRLAEATDGFLYLVGTYGVTGARSELDPRTRELVTATRDQADGTPVCVGFGVSKREHAAALREAGADGVVVGSALVDTVAAGEPPSALREQAANLEEGTRP